MMSKDKILAFDTHYEILDYQMGQYAELEKSLSYYDFNTFTNYPRYLYDDVRNILYIPRGIDHVLLEDRYGKEVTYVKNTTNPQQIFFKLKTSPRDEIQKKAIRYLVGLDEFKSTKNESQKVLIMPPGYGKTYCTIAALQRLGQRALIIMHTKNLKNQWMEKFKEYTDMGGPNIIEISSSEQLHSYLRKPPSDNNMIFITTRRLLTSYGNKYGLESLNEVISKMGIGVKIFDEAHKEYSATFLIDYATNVKYTIYLTATFSLSDPADNRIFQLSYNTVRKLQIRQDDDMRHIIYIAIMFNSNPSPLDEHKISGRKRGFNRYQYIDYEMKKGILENEVRDILSFFKKKNNMEGKTLILSSKKSTCDHFNDVVQSELQGMLTSCSFYTDNKVENYKEYDAISATPAMLGTGEDIPGLRFLINTEPGASLPNTDQFSGRLRPYKGGSKPTYYIEFVDVGFPLLVKWYKRRKKLLEKKVKECHELDRTIRFND